MGAVITGDIVKCRLPALDDGDKWHTYRVHLSNDGTNYNGLAGDSGARTVWNSALIKLECLTIGNYLPKVNIDPV